MITKIKSPQYFLSSLLDEVSTETGMAEEISPTGEATFIALALVNDSWALVMLKIASDGKQVWTAIPESYDLGITASTELSVATVNGYSYLYLSEIGAFIYVADREELQERELKGLEPTSLRGIIAAQGYLLAYSDTAISWSSVVNVEDFEPSEVSGSGGGNVQEVKGEIVVCRPTYLGFIMYATGNAVSVTYSGNEDFPWVFKAISSSGGVTSPDQVSLEETGGYQHAYTSNGIQQVSHQRSNTVMVHITDFISGTLFEDFNSDTMEFISTRIPAGTEMRKSLAVISDRFLIISYGLPQLDYFTHAIVVDLVQQRMGKLKFQHTACYERVPIAGESAISVKSAIAFVHPDTNIYVVNFDTTAETDSVLLLGKYQLQRGRMVELQEVIVENPEEDREGSTSDFELYALPSLDGKNTSAKILGYEHYRDTDVRKYYFTGVVGESYSLLLRGRFNLIGFVTHNTVHGRY